MLTLFTLTLLAGLAQPADQPAPTPTPAPAQPTPAAAAQTPAFPDAKALLIALEKADEGLDQLQAGVRYDVLEVDVDDRTIRLGDLFFDRVKDEAGKPVRRFAVRFTKLLVGTSTREDERIHCFDGRWYAEKSPAQKKINRKEVAPPGELVDPLKIGEGPLPIPIGQKHQDRSGAHIVGTIHIRGWHIARQAFRRQLARSEKKEPATAGKNKINPDAIAAHVRKFVAFAGQLPTGQL